MDNLFGAAGVGIIDIPKGIPFLIAEPKFRVYAGDSGKIDPDIVLTRLLNDELIPVIVTIFLEIAFDALADPEFIGLFPVIIWLDFGFDLGPGR
jgi:hypothetical protein